MKAHNGNFRVNTWQSLNTEIQKYFPWPPSRHSGGIFLTSFSGLHLTESSTISHNGASGMAVSDNAKETKCLELAVHFYVSYCNGQVFRSY